MNEAAAVDEWKSRDLDGVFLPYQREVYRAVESGEHSLIVYEKSRRIGLTWGLSAWGALKAARSRAAKGSDVLYIGYSLEMAREFIDECASWMRAFGVAAATMNEFIFEDAEADGNSKGIKGFRISCASGFEVIALSSRPRSLRGKQGAVIIDEAAFHDDLPGLLKAALALTMWGGQVIVVSTHNGVDNPFNELLADIRAGKRKGAHAMRTTLREAIEQGLVRRILLRRSVPWSPEAEAAWEAGVRGPMGDAAAEELDCIPRASGGRYLPRTLLEARAKDVPVIRLTLQDDFVDLPEDERVRRTQEWFDAEVLPLIKALPSGVRSHVGEDFGRSGDLSVQWPLITEQTMARSTPFVIELRNVPFTTQQQILFALCDALPGFGGAALDARGNGQFLAETARQRYGAECIAEVMLSEGWYREHMPPLKSALEDAQFDLPRDKDVIGDFASLMVVNGVARVEGHTTGADNKQRHGDTAIAGALALFASRTLDSGPLHIGAVAGASAAHGAFSDQKDLTSRDWKGWLA